MVLPLTVLLDLPHIIVIRNILEQQLQRERGDYWTMASYTEQGQVAFTAEVQLASISHNDLMQYWNTESDTVSFSATGQGIAYFGYVTDAQIEQPLVVNYYDNYDFLSILPSDIQTNLTYNARTGFGEQYANSTGLLTGKRVYSLAENTYTTTAYYYDADGNIIQQRSTLWNGGYDVLWAAYNFDGTVSRTLEQQPLATDAYWYEYDMSGRLLRTRYQLNDEPVILLSNNTYTELGQLDTILRHNDTDITNYDYNPRGNATLISSGDFSEQITYVKNGHGYNGTISATTLTQGDVTLQWDYQYDSHNRLSSAHWSEGGDSWEAEKFTYDPMGNILTLKRRNRETLIDDLNYSYAGNQLKAISDAEGEQSLYDQKEYLDYSNTENEMNYDANGNLLQDFDRKICTIQYNLLNLPEIIQFCNGNNIVNTYNAEGVKLSSTYYTLPEAVAVPVGEIVEPDTLPQAPQTMIVQYLGHIERTMIGDSVSYTLHHPEGYITLDALHRVDSWNYFRRDHLGNNVTVWNATADTTIQRMFYYPSGLPMSISIGQGAQPYKYNGKEYDEMHGLNEYDSHARWYYPAIMRTTTMDPLAEKYYNISPYAWCGNNFLNAIDPDGRDSIYVNDQPERPVDRGVEGETYTATVIVVQDGEIVGEYRGSSYPNSKSNTDNSTSYNTINEGEYLFNNESGHKMGTEQGLNIVDDNGNRVASGKNPEGEDVIIEYANVHSGKSDKGNHNSRGSHACITIHPDDAKSFFSHFVWTNDKKTTGTSKGRIFIKRDKDNKEKKK